MIIDELLVALGWEVDEESQKEVKEFDDSLVTILGTMKKLAIGAVATAGAVGFFVKQVSNANDELGKNARSIGAEVEDLDALSHAMEIATGSADGLASSMKTYSKNLGEAKRGTGPAIEALGMLGLDAHELSKDIVGSVGVISESLKSFDRQTQLDLIDKLGLSDMVLLLDEGADGINNLLNEAKDLGVVNNRIVKSSERLNDSWTRGMRVIKVYASEVSAFIAETMADYIDDLVQWSKVGFDLIRRTIDMTQALGGLKSILDKVLIVLSAIFALGVFASIGTLTKMILTLAKAINLTTLKLIAMKVALYAEFILIGSLIAGVIVILEDLWKTIENGEGAFSKFYSLWLEWLGTDLDAVTDFWADFIYKLETQDWAGAFKKIFNTMKEEATEVIKGLYELLPDIFKGNQQLDYSKMGINQGFVPALNNAQSLNNSAIGAVSAVSAGSRSMVANNQITVNVNGNATPENITMMRRELESVLINAQRESEVEVIG